MNAPRMSLDAYLASLPGRCAGCGHHLKLQGCRCNAPAAHKSQGKFHDCTNVAPITPQQLRDAGQQLATAAHPDDRAKVDAAIRQLAATGQPFSANTARQIHGVKGGVVGAAFTAARKAGLIERIGREPSSAASTHCHEISQWVGVNAKGVAA